MDERNVLRGKIPDAPIPQENLGFVLHRILTSQKKSKIAFINDETGEALTFGQLLEDSRRLAQCFCSYGMINDKIIAICSDNHVNYFTVVLAALYMGIPVTLINPQYTEYELQHAITVVKPSMIFCSSRYSEKFAKLKYQNRFIRKIVAIDSTKTTPHADSFQKFLIQYSDRLLASLGFTTRQVNVKDHKAFILFSSGTTGLPKGVVHTHFSVSASIISIEDPIMNRSDGLSITLAVLPFFHIYGLFVGLLGLYSARTVILLEKFVPELYLKNIEKYKITQLFTVPPLIQFLLKSEVVNKYDLSSIKEIICGGATLGKDLLEAAVKKFKVRQFRQGYALTEAGGPVSYTLLDDFSCPTGSVGQAFPGMSFVIKDVDTGENLGPHKNGEICAKGSNLMIGYYGNEEATKNVFTEDGWFKTGDIGYYDDNGYLYIVDRIKELIKYKGFQVAPAELEQILVTNPKIEDAGVVGLPDEGAGELPLAFVVKKPGVVLTEQEVQKYLEKFVSRNKHLRGGVIFIDEIPRNPSGKILRKELKKLLMDKKSKL